MGWRWLVGGCWSIQAMGLQAAPAATARQPPRQQAPAAPTHPEAQTSRPPARQRPLKPTHLPTYPASLSSLLCKLRSIYFGLVPTPPSLPPSLLLPHCTHLLHGVPQPLPVRHLRPPAGQREVPFHTGDTRTTGQLCIACTVLRVLLSLCSASKHQENTYTLVTCIKLLDNSTHDLPGLECPVCREWRAPVSPP